MYAPVRSIAEASTTGHGTNIITGVAVGMKSTVIPCITVSVAVIAAYHLGKTAGVGDGHNAGLFGTAVATMGMLSSAVYVLSMNNFGEIVLEVKGVLVGCLAWPFFFWFCFIFFNGYWPKLLKPPRGLGSSFAGLGVCAARVLRYTIL